MPRLQERAKCLVSQLLDEREQRKSKETASEELTLALSEEDTLPDPARPVWWPRKLFQPETESGLMCTRRKVGARGLGEFQQSFWTEQFVIILAVFCIIVTSLWNIIPCAYDGLSLFLSAIANLWIIWIVWWETNKRNQVAVKWYNWLGWSFY